MREVFIVSGMRTPIGDAKCFAADTAMRVATDAVQIYEGTNQISGLLLLIMF